MIIFIVLLNLNLDNNNSSEYWLYDKTQDTYNYMSANIHIKTFIYWKIKVF